MPVATSRHSANQELLREFAGCRHTNIVMANSAPVLEFKQERRPVVVEAGAVIIDIVVADRE